MINVFEKAINDFYPTFYKLEELVGKPKIVSVQGITKIRYEKKNIKTICLIKTARIISSLNSILILFEKGFFLEIGVIIRTIKEAISEVQFLLEIGIDVPLLPSQQKYLDNFFKEEFNDFSNPIESAKIDNRVPSKKIRASVTRSLENLKKTFKEGEVPEEVESLLKNPAEFQKLQEVLLNTFSGYLHYSYSQSMEMVVGNPLEFKLRGFNEYYRIKEWEGGIVRIIDELFNYFKFLCFRFEFHEEAKLLLKNCTHFLNNTKKYR